MTTPCASTTSNSSIWRHRDAAGWLGLAASPSFALMAWLAGTDAFRFAICAPASGMPPVGGMAGMYLLMSLFHLAPWLKLASARQD